jgi:hypothetical protein
VNKLDASGGYQKVKEGCLRTKVYKSVVKTEKIDDANWKVTFPAKTIFIGKRCFEQCASVAMRIFKINDDLKIASIRSKKKGCPTPR